MKPLPVATSRFPNSRNFPTKNGRSNKNRPLLRQSRNRLTAHFNHGTGRFLQKLLGVRRKGNQYIADCPVCGKAGHLYIKDDGVLLAFCQHCKARLPAILRAVGGMNRDGESPVPIPKPKKNRTLVEFITYEYRNPDGTVAYCKDRKNSMTATRNSISITRTQAASR